VNASYPVGQLFLHTDRGFEGDVRLFHHPEIFANARGVLLLYVLAGENIGQIFTSELHGHFHHHIIHVLVQL
jgi:hypothetical protein